ncbi:unnamed protein product [Phytomonas sp. Hart1]|nr:unnamed protein product [Phytomonas sp. Hart1]|eukprot:CCW70029.1 unnamed protein product [Phytomonas sp. isolate Hart1]
MQNKDSVFATQGFLFTLWSIFQLFLSSMLSLDSLNQQIEGFRLQSRGYAIPQGRTWGSVNAAPRGNLLRRFFSGPQQRPHPSSTSGGVPGSNIHTLPPPSCCTGCCQ